MAFFLQGIILNESYRCSGRAQSRTQAQEHSIRSALGLQRTLIRTGFKLESFVSGCDPERILSLLGRSSDPGPQAQEGFVKAGLLNVKER